MTPPRADSVPGSVHQLFWHKMENTITIQNHQDENDRSLAKKVILTEPRGIFGRFLFGGGSVCKDLSHKGSALSAPLKY